MEGVARQPWRLLAVLLAVLLLPLAVWWKWVEPETAACRAAGKLATNELLAQAQKRYLQALERDRNAACAKKGIQRVVVLRCEAARRLELFELKTYARAVYKDLAKGLGETSAFENLPWSEADFQYTDAVHCIKGIISATQKSTRAPKKKPDKLSSTP
jgi:hypothetical protein